MHSTDDGAIAEIDRRHRAERPETTGQTDARTLQTQNEVRKS
ncbi:hypothetical protein CKA32_001924 [Geitlerinema sp. FC II]|nr:hypothetical protein CKA32_001924 [Geitlerinema sp. FC II]